MPLDPHYSSPCPNANNAGHMQITKIEANKTCRNKIATWESSEKKVTEKGKGEKKNR